MAGLSGQLPNIGAQGADRAGSPSQLLGRGCRGHCGVHGLSCLGTFCLSFPRMAELDPSHSSQPNTSPPPGGAPAVRDAEVVVSLRQISESPAVDKGKEQALPPEGACSQSMSPDPSFRLSGTMGATESASPILASKDKEAPDESAGKDNSEMAHAPSQYVDIPRTQASPHAGTLGTLSGVLIPTCENMWGVLIFLRFFQVVGQAGVLLTLVIVFMSYLCVSFTALSLSAIATNGPIDKGGAYFLISRALGPQIGGSVGCVYYLGITLLAVLEVLGAVEMLLYMVEELRFPGAVRLSATVCMLTLAGMVFLGIRSVPSPTFFLRPGPSGLAAQMDRGSIRHRQTVPGLERVNGGAPFPL